MFEKYTEKARRVVFFARYEASNCRSPYIETEHLLLGLLREERAMMRRMLSSHEASNEMAQELRVEHPERPPVSTSVDLPLSEESKRVLSYAAAEAERLAHRHIGPEHMLLGLLREEKFAAAHALNQHGLTLEKARSVIASEVPPGVAYYERMVGPGAGLNKPYMQLGQFNSYLEMVNNVTGEQVDLWPLQPFVPVPRIGEEVVLGDREKIPRTFRVINVSYEYYGTKLETVRLRVEPLPQQASSS